MDRRIALKFMGWGTLSAGMLLEACSAKDKQKTLEAAAAGDSKVTLDRFPEEAANDKRLQAETFFTKDEMVTITVLGDIIIPRDEVSGSASDAKVPDFIEFIVKDMPEHQVPMRGGLRWLDLQMARRHGKAFRDCTESEQIALVDEIAYPEKAKPEMKQGVAFFSLMRNLTSTGFYTSEIGIKDIGYKGNTPNQWNGVPDEVLKQYGLAYTEKELRECVKVT